MFFIAVDIKGEKRQGELNEFPWTCRQCGCVKMFISLHLPVFPIICLSLEINKMSSFGKTLYVYEKHDQERGLVFTGSFYTGWDRSRPEAVNQKLSQGLPHGWWQPNYLNCHLLPPILLLAGNWSLEWSHDLNPGTAIWDSGILNHVFRY